MPSWSRAILMKSLPTSLDERLLQMVVVAEQIGRGQQRPGRNLLGDVGRRQVAEFEVVALQGDELGALLEQRVAPVGLEIEVVLHRRGERLVALGAKICFGEGDRQPQLRFRLTLRRSRQSSCRAALRRRPSRYGDQSASCPFPPEGRQFLIPMARTASGESASFARLAAQNVPTSSFCQTRRRSECRGQRRT